MPIKNLRLQIETSSWGKNNHQKNNHRLVFCKALQFIRHRKLLNL